MRRIILINSNCSNVFSVERKEAESPSVRPKTGAARGGPRDAEDEEDA